VNARNARRAAAAAWLAALSSNPDTTYERDALHQALLAEDAAVQAYLKQHTDPAARQTRLRWLLLKRRIAAGGIGDRLVPEWTANGAQTRVQLSAAWAGWLATYDKNNRQGQATCASRQAIVAAYWGLYPDALIADLLLAAQGAANLGGLHLGIVKSGTPPVVGWQEQTD
jgi:hypothetical protein